MVPDGAAAKAAKAEWSDWYLALPAYELEPSPQRAFLAGYLAGFRAVLDAVEAKMPGAAATGTATERFAWDLCRKNCLDLIASLRSPPSQPGQQSERGTGGGA